MYCGKCGQELPDEAQFCWKCGQAVAAAGRLPATPSLVELSCPKCAGRLAVSPDLNKLTCGSCGSELLIMRDDKTVTLRLGKQEQELISALTPAPYPKEKTCPLCGRIDQVQAVTAVVGAHPEAGLNPPATVQKLRLSLPVKADARLLKMGFLFFVGGWILGLGVLAISPGGGLTLGVLATLCLIVSVTIYSHDKRKYRQAFARHEIVTRRWQTLNYCHRCDRVFVPGASVVMTPDEMEGRLYAEAVAS
jgi:hypothetical protein